MGFLKRFEGTLFGLLRVVAGFTFACHGAQKLFGVLGGHVMSDPLMVTAGIVEFGGGVLIALGLFASYAAFVASGEMAVAYFKAHLPGGFWPILNHGELAVVYCFLWLYIAAHGPGNLSLDRIFRRGAAR